MAVRGVLRGLGLLFGPNRVIWPVLIFWPVCLLHLPIRAEGPQSASAGPTSHFHPSDIVKLIVSNPVSAHHLQAQVAGFPWQDPAQTRETGACAELRTENAKLKQIIRLLAALNPDLGLDLGERNDPSQLARMAQHSAGEDHFLERPLETSVSLESSLITPTPTWSTSFQTSTFAKVTTETVAKEIPIIWRGQRIVTTISDSFTDTVTTTEIIAHSTQITPTPRWTTHTVTVSSQPKPLPPLVRSNREPVRDTEWSRDPTRPQAPRLWPHIDTHHRAFDPTTGQEHADVLEIQPNTTAAEAKARLEALKQAYGIFFASNTVHEHAQRFNEIIRRGSDEANFIRHKSQGEDFQSAVYASDAHHATPVEANVPDQLAQPLGERAIIAPSPVAPIEMTHDPLAQDLALINRQIENLHSSGDPGANQ